MYTFNAHGDVVAIINVTGTNAGKFSHKYTYDAFGNESGVDANDANPFRYCGEWWDKVTKRLYLRARDYDASTGRFTSEDPARSGLNFYTYCENNPILWIDPSGYDVILHGTDDQMKEQLKYYQELCDYPLAYAEDGTIYVVTYTKLPGKNHPISTQLTLDLINMTRTTHIIYRYGMCASLGEEIDPNNAYIYFDPNYISYVYEYEDGFSGSNAVLRRIPKHIMLAHELIHAYRFLNGLHSDADNERRIHQFYDKDSWMGWRKENIRIEEFKTVGWDIMKQGDFYIDSQKYSENKIRSEFGLHERLSYTNYVFFWLFPLDTPW